MIYHFETEIFLNWNFQSVIFRIVFIVFCFLLISDCLTINKVNDHNKFEKKSDNDRFLVHKYIQILVRMPSISLLKRCNLDLYWARRVAIVK